MARIRAIKPEFWSSPNHPADPWARLLFIAMWNWADDAGVGTANLKELAGFAFPNDDEIGVGAMRRLCADVSAHYGAQFYTVGARPYYSIPSWRDHQKFDSRRTGKHPGPDEAETWLYQDEPEKSAQCADSAPQVRPHVGASSAPEQGNLGTVEDRNSVLTLVTEQQTARPRAKNGAALARQAFDELNTTAHSGQAHTIAQAFSRSQPAPIEHRLLSDIATEIDSCINAGIPPPQIATGLEAWQESDCWSTKQIPRFVQKAGQSKKSTSTKRVEQLDKLKEPQ